MKRGAHTPARILLSSAGALLGAILLILFMACADPEFSSPQFEWGVGTTGGAIVEFWSDGSFRVKRHDGTYRPATASEADEAREQAAPSHRKGSAPGSTAGFM